MKKILIAITSIIFVLVLLLLSVPYWFDVNDYKQQIVSAIKEKSGFDVTIGGKITARVVPDISLVVEDVSVIPSQKNGANVFSSKQLVLNVRLAPIFNKKIEIDSLRLIEPIINLHVNKLGENNWELKKVGKLPESLDEVTEVAYGEAAKSNDLSGNFSLNELEIKDGLFKFFDEQSGKTIDVSGLNIHTSIKQGDNNLVASGKLNIFEKKEKGIFSLKGSYSLGVAVYKAQNLDITLDDIKANGDIESDFSNIKPAFKVSLYTNEIKVDDYKMAGASGAENAQATAPSAVNEASSRQWSAEKFNVDFLNKADVNLNFKASGIKSGTLNIGEAAVNSYLKNGRLTVNLKDVSLYGGIVNVEAVIDVASGLPVLKAIFDIVNIDIAKLSEGSSKKESIAGKANIRGGLYSAGDNQRAIIEKLSGKATLNVVDGMVKGVDLISMVKSLPTAFDTENSDNKTKFQEISGDFDIKNGIVTNENFILKSDVVNFEGRGEINLPQQTINYKLTPKYSQGFQKADEEKPVIPILISGNMYKPLFRLELKTIVQDLINNPEAAKNLVNQLKRDFKDVKKDITGEDAGKALKNLFQ